MVRYVPAVHSTDSAVVRTLRAAQHAHRESPVDPRPVVMVTATKLDDDGRPIGIVRRLERAEPVRSFRPTGTDRGETSRENILGARAVAVRADAMRHARAVLGMVGPGEEGPEPSATSVFGSLADPATVNALRVLAVAGMHCVVSRANARGEVSTVYRPVDPFGREASEAIGSLWWSHTNASWRHGAPTTATGVVAYLRTIVGRMSRLIGPRARKGGPAAPLPLVCAADVVGAGGIEALQEAEHAASMLGKATARVADANARHGAEVARFIDEASALGVGEARRRIRSDATAQRAMARLRIELAALGEESEED